MGFVFFLRALKGFARSLAILSSPLQTVQFSSWEKESLDSKMVFVYPDFEVRRSLLNKAVSQLNANSALSQTSGAGVIHCWRGLVLINFGTFIPDKTRPPCFHRSSGKTSSSAQGRNPCCKLGLTYNPPRDNVLWYCYVWMSRLTDQIESSSSIALCIYS